MFQKKVQFFKKHKPFQNLITYGIGQGFNLITPLLVIPYIVAVCSEEGYGKISVGMALAFFLIVFIDYGSDIVGVKDVSVNRENRDKLEKIFVTMYAAKFVMLVLVCALVSIVFVAVPYFSHEKALFFLSLFIIIGQFVNPTWFLQGTENFKWITILNIISKIIYVIGIFVFIRKPSDYIYNNFFWGIGMIVANGIAFVHVCRMHHFSFKATQRDEVYGLITANFSMFSSQIFVSLQMYSPIVLISFFGNNTMAGQYKIVDQIIVVFKTYILLFFNYAYPRVCFLLEKNVKEGLQFWKVYNGANMVFVTVSMAVIYVFSNEIVAYFNPVSPIEISAFLRIAVLIPILQSIGIPLKQLVIGWNKQRQYITITMISTLISMVLILIAIPFFKIPGLIYALILTEIVTIVFFFGTIKNNLFQRGS